MMHSCTRRLFRTRLLRNSPFTRLNGNVFQFHAFTIGNMRVIRVNHSRCRWQPNYVAYTAGDVCVCRAGRDRSGVSNKARQTARGRLREHGDATSSDATETRAGVQGCWRQRKVSIPPGLMVLSVISYPAGSSVLNRQWLDVFQMLFMHVQLTDWDLKLLTICGLLRCFRLTFALFQSFTHRVLIKMAAPNFKSLVL